MRSALVIGLAKAAMFGGAVAQEVPFPDGYRDWHHVKSMVLQTGHPLYETFGGIHHIYANPLALEGYPSGSFPDGAVIVFDLLDAVEADAAISEGARKVVGVMHRDATTFAATGGWGFEGFAGGDPATRAVGAGNGDACFGCHQEQAAPSFVFSRLRP
jgi:hypothetical protein